MSQLYQYIADGPSWSEMHKGPSSEPSFRVNWAAGMDSALTLSSCGVTATGSDGNDASARIYNTNSVSGTIGTFILRTGGTSGTGDASDKDRFRLRIRAHLSNGQVLVHDAFIYVEAKDYDPVP